MTDEQPPPSPGQGQPPAQRPEPTTPGPYGQPGGDHPGGAGQDRPAADGGVPPTGGYPQSGSPQGGSPQGGYAPSGPGYGAGYGGSGYGTGGYGATGYGQGPRYSGYNAPEADKATPSLVLGIVSLVLIGFCGVAAPITGVIAIVFGNRAIREIDASGGQLVGREKAQAGRVMGWIAIVLGILVVIGIILAVVFALAVGHSTPDGTTSV